MKQLSDRLTYIEEGEVDQNRNIMIFLNASLFMCVLWLFVFVSMLASGTISGNFGDITVGNMSNLLLIGIFFQVVIILSLFSLANGRLFGYYGLFVGFLVNIYLGLSFDFLLLLNGVIGFWALRHYVGSKKVLLS